MLLIKTSKSAQNGYQNIWQYQRCRLPIEHVLLDMDGVLKSGYSPGGRVNKTYLPGC